MFFVGEGGTSDSTISCVTVVKDDLLFNIKAYFYSYKALTEEFELMVWVWSVW